MFGEEKIWKYHLEYDNEFVHYFFPKVVYSFDL